jgi:hypothetical protein
MTPEELEEEYEKLRRKGTRQLINLDVTEVSLVTRGANRRKFSIVKSEGPMIKELIAKLCGERAVAIEKKITEDAQQALAKALELVGKYTADYPADIADAIGTLAKLAAANVQDYGKKPKKPKKPGDYGYGYPEQKGDVRYFLGHRVTAPVAKSAGEADSWPSLDAIGGVLLPAGPVSKGDEGEEEDVDQDKQPAKPARGVKKSVDGQDTEDDGLVVEGGEAEDLWPSL